MSRTVTISYAKRSQQNEYKQIQQELKLELQQCLHKDEKQQKEQVETKSISQVVTKMLAITELPDVVSTTEFKVTTTTMGLSSLPLNAFEEISATPADTSFKKNA